MASITSAGVGSGLDIEGLLSRLVAAERAPVEQRLNRREAQLQARLSAYGILKGAVSSFRTAVGGLSASAAFNKRTASSSDSSVLTASAASSAAEGSYAISVSARATAQTLAMADGTGFTDPADIVGTGTLTFKFGTTTTGPYAFTQNPDRATHTVTIDSSNNTLAGIRDAVNAADIGVSASIVFDGDEHRLVFASTSSGAANSIQVSVDEDTGIPADNLDTSGLSVLAYNGDAANLEQTAAAADAAFTVNGVPVSSASNTVDDAIDGVTLTLKAAGSTTLTVSADDGAALSTARKFVDAYNSLVGTITDLSGYDAESQSGGILIGDATVRSVSTRLRGVLGTSVSGLNGNYTSLSAVGITTDVATGKLTLDTAKFEAALAAEPEVVQRLFAATGEASDPLVQFEGYGEGSTVGDHAVTITQLATRGSLTGAAIGSLTVTASNDTLQLVVDGISSGTITLTQASYTETSLAAELQARINGDQALRDAGVAVSVGVNAGKLVITSNRYGSASTVEIAAVDTDTLADLGLDVQTGTDGIDVAGTIGGVAATGSGRTLTGAGDASGIRIEVLGGALGSRGTVSFTRGYAALLDGVLDELLGSDSPIDARSDGVQSRIDDIGEQRVSLERRMDALETQLRAQFTALDSLMAQLQATSDYLTQQLAALPGSNRNNR